MPDRSPSPWKVALLAGATAGSVCYGLQYLTGLLPPLWHLAVAGLILGVATRFLVKMYRYARETERETEEIMEQTRRMVESIEREQGLRDRRN